MSNPAAASPPQSTRLNGMRAIITGAGEGLGKSIAEAFAREGARLLLLEIDRFKADAVVTSLQAEGYSASMCVGSVAEAADVRAAFVQADAVLGGVDILVNNAGVSANCPALDIDDEFWDRAMAVNLRGAFLCSRAAGRRMVAQRSGVILNIASMYAVTPAPERLAYCVSKSGIAMMARALAAEWGPSGVRVNALAPGYIQTSLLDDLVARGRLDVEQLRARTPLRRLAGAAEVAEFAVFMCSPAAAFITGQVAGIDGGWTAYGYV